MKSFYLGVQIETNKWYMRILNVPDDYTVGDKGAVDRTLIDSYLVTLSLWATDMGHSVLCSYAGFRNPDSGAVRKEVVSNTSLPLVA